MARLVGLPSQDSNSPLQGSWKTYIPELNRFNTVPMDAEMIIAVAPETVTITRHFVRGVIPPVSVVYVTDGHAHRRPSDNALVTATWITKRRLEVLTVESGRTTQDTYEVSDDATRLRWTTLRAGTDERPDTREFLR